MEKPDWSLWLHVPSVTLEECVCLSLDADPLTRVQEPPRERDSTQPTEPRPSDWAAPVLVSSYRPSAQERNEMLAQSHPTLLSQEGKGRLLRLLQHFTRRHVLLPQAVPYEARVSLMDFARWAAAQGWRVPPQLDMSPAAAIIAKASVRATAALATPRKLTAEQEERIVQLYDRAHGWSVNKLAAEFGVHRRTIDATLKRAGVK